MLQSKPKMPLSPFLTDKIKASLPLCFIVSSTFSVTSPFPLAGTLGQTFF